MADTIIRNKKGERIGSAATKTGEDVEAAETTEKLTDVSGVAAKQKPAPNAPKAGDYATTQEYMTAMSKWRRDQASTPSPSPLPVKPGRAADALEKR